MPKNKIKVIGYAQRIFLDNGIEYRPFSPDLVGQQFTSDGGTPLFTAGNFVVTINDDPKVSKTFTTSKFSDFFGLNDIVENDIQLNILTDTSVSTLNLNPSKLNNYAYFGSAGEFLRVSLEHIISTWPASIYVKVYKDYSSGYTIENYNYDTVNNVASFSVPVNRIDNKFQVIFNKNGNVFEKYSQNNELKNLTVRFLDYSVSGSTGEFNIIEFTGSTTISSGYLYLKVKGNPFNETLSNQYVNFHIKPNENRVNEFFVSLPKFEKHLLNRQTSPIYSSKFIYTVKTDNGVSLETQKEINWPVSDGYNIDFDSPEYIKFASDLVDLTNASDEVQSDIISRFLVSKSITEFDTISDTDDETEQKIGKTLRIYGREFDEIKKYIDGISLANVVTYDKNDNTPDNILKALARTLGWELTSSLQDNDLINSFLTPAESTFSGYSVGLTKHEAEIELWRRLVLNTPWIWKSKGTRKAVEFFLKFIGAPNGLIRFNEYVYNTDKNLDIEEFLRVLDINTNTTSIDNICIDNDGFPKTLPDTPDMYFQKGGLWYRQTGGPNADLDLLAGNNPHIGPYDRGYEYINQFKCLIPNFSATTLIEETLTTGTTNLFSNYNNGLINNFLSSEASATCTTDVDFNSILLSETQDCFNNNDNSLPKSSGCPSGYNINEDSTKCVKYDTQDPLSYVQGPIIVSNNENKELVYSFYGAVFYEDITDKPEVISTGTTWAQRFLRYSDGSIVTINNTTSNIYWGNGSYLNYIGQSYDNTLYTILHRNSLPDLLVTGRLNIVGIDSDASVETTWHGFSKCFDLSETKIYYIGLAADNLAKFYVNGELKVNLAGGEDTFSNFKFWHVFPITLSAGKNIIEMFGKNITGSHNFGFEIYDPEGVDEQARYNNLVNASNMSESGSIWNTAEMVGSYFDVGNGLGYTCADGYSVDLCDNPVKCTSISYTALTEGCVSCPTGFKLNSDETKCVRTDVVYDPNVGQLVPITNGDVVRYAYGIAGTRLYENIDSFYYPISTDYLNLMFELKDSLNNYITYSGITQAENMFYGERLNNIGIRGNEINKWYGLTKCINIPETKIYYIGLAADNLCSFRVNGVPIIEFSGTDSQNSTLSFKYWHIFPITLNAGENLIELLCFNFEDTMAFGAEIYDPEGIDEGGRSTELMNATNKTDAGVIWSTEHFRDKGNIYFEMGDGIGYQCPDGYALDLCGERISCKKIEYVEPISNCPTIDDCTFVIDWSINIKIGGELKYVGTPFYTSISRTDVPTTIAYESELSVGLSSISLNSTINDGIVYITTSGGTQCDIETEFNGKLLEISLISNINITSGIIANCINEVVICDSVFETDTPEIYIDALDPYNLMADNFEVISSFIIDPCPSSKITTCGCAYDTCDHSIKVKIKKTKRDYGCEYTEYNVDENNYVWFTLNDGTKTKYISEACCQSLGSGFVSVDSGLSSCEKFCVKQN